MHRFFIDKNHIKGESVHITGSDFNHISHSLRLQSGDQIIVCTGDGFDIIVELTDFTENFVAGKIIDYKQSESEPLLKVTLAQAIPKNKNMELIIQKCTEIGVFDIIPLETERTIVKLSSKKKQQRLQRWRRLAEEAAKQSQRGRIPEIKDIHNLKNIVEISSNFDVIFILWEEENNNSFRKIFNEIDKGSLDNVLMIVGPEGGFSQHEVDFIRQETKGYSLTLGPRILRTETAGFVGLTLLLYEFGEMGVKQ